MRPSAGPDPEAPDRVKGRDVTAVAAHAVPEVVGTVMINARPGYWDMDRCSWVGVEPTYVVPPLRHADHPHDRVAGRPGQVPASRHRREEPADVAVEVEATAVDSA
jgi:hypothetical protein